METVPPEDPPGEGEGPEPQGGDPDLGLELDVDRTTSTSSASCPPPPPPLPSPLPPAPPPPPVPDPAPEGEPVGSARGRQPSRLGLGSPVLRIAPGRPSRQDPQDSATPAGHDLAPPGQQRTPAGRPPLSLDRHAAP